MPHEWKGKDPNRGQRPVLKSAAKTLRFSEREEDSRQMGEPYIEPNAKASHSRAINVFYSYSHSDETFRVELEKHLSQMRRNGEIAGWHDRNISAGTEWRACIDKNLESADIILLLVSADFLASDYCYEIEMKRAMTLHTEGKARVIPIILRECDWSSAPFAKLQALPRNAQPIKNWSNPDQAYHNVVMGIRQAVTQKKNGLPTQATNLGPRPLRIRRAGKFALLAIMFSVVASSAYIWFGGDRPTAMMVTGFVVDSEDHGIEHAQVKTDTLPAMKPVETGSSGRFIINDVPGKPGDWIFLEVSKEGYEGKREQFILNDSPKPILLNKKK